MSTTARSASRIFFSPRRGSRRRLATLAEAGRAVATRGYACDEQARHAHTSDAAWRLMMLTIPGYDQAAEHLGDRRRGQAGADRGGAVDAVGLTHRPVGTGSGEMTLGKDNAPSIGPPEEHAARAAESALGPNPFIGLRGRKILASVQQVAGQANLVRCAQPLRHSAVNAKSPGSRQQEPMCSSRRVLSRRPDQPRRGALPWIPQ